MTRWTPPAFVSLSWSDLQRQHRRKERVRFALGLVASFVLVVLVPLVVMRLIAGPLPEVLP